MKASSLALAAAGLAAAGAQAQLVEPSSPSQLQRQIQPQDQAFAKSFQPLPHPYMRNEAEIPDIKMFGDDYRVDPKLRAGFDLNPNFAIEAGYQNLYSRGFHYVEPGRAAERAGALGTAGSAGYLAGKVTVPVDEHLSAYGKLGHAFSERTIHDSDTTSARDVDAGPYVNVGAKYKLSDKISVNAQYEKYGDSAKKFGNDSNGSAVSAKLNVGF
jgi:opacity protein-like surface antigen